MVRARTPDRFGLAQTLWTRAAVADWAQSELGVVLSAPTWGRWLKAQGYTPQKVARRACERDGATVRRWLQDECPRLAQRARAEGAEAHWLDEGGLRSDGSLGKGYAPGGRTPVRRIPGRRFGVNYPASLSSAGVLRFLAYGGKLTGAILITFLARRLARRPCKLYVVLDSHLFSIQFRPEYVRAYFRAGPVRYAARPAPLLPISCGGHN
jgi:hypothetical protein